jgi:F0F1-type ATP synthase assembly protein I
MVSQALVGEAGRTVLKGPEQTVFDLSAKRELNNGFGNALSAAVDLTVTPMLVGLLGWWLDRTFGTTPAFTLVFFAFTIGYVAWKQYNAYQARMAKLERDLLGDRPSTRSER